MVATTSAGQKKILSVHRALFAWYRRFGRHELPWRKTSDPYKILVSEIMLQQTQVDAVIPKYLAFLREFPTFRLLAAASSRDVILAWKGLGYNRRALNLWRTAQKVVREFGGVLPSSTAELRTLPGVGPYTAESLRAFVFHAPTSALDTNIRRVIHRVFAGSDLPEPRLRDAELVELSQSVVPRARAYDWNSALMDLGSSVCKVKPLCEACPLRDVCSAYPKILTQRKRVRVVREPHPVSTPNIPNRIYRGRVVEVLRSREQVSIAQLGPLIKPDFGDDDHGWLAKIIAGLERDGLLVRCGTRLSLPS